MQPRNFISLDPTDLLPVSFGQKDIDAENGSSQDTPVVREWGAFTMRNFILPHVRILRFEGKFTQNIHLGDHSNEEVDTVNCCFGLEGMVTSSFSGFKQRMGISKGRHNFIYKPEHADDHYIEKTDNLHMLHMEIDRSYFTELLTNDERPSAILKEKILSKERVAGADQMLMPPQIQRVIYDMLHCTFSGNLRNIWMEGKMLELIAYQLQQYMMTNQCGKSTGWSTKDRDVFFELKKYLDESFTEPHSLNSLSKKFGLNEFKLKKGFKELFGITVFEHLHELKMNHARTLLCDSRLYVNEVSGVIGYKNPNHFSAAFKKRFGVSPKEI